MSAVPTTQPDDEQLRKLPPRLKSQVRGVICRVMWEQENKRVDDNLLDKAEDAFVEIFRDHDTARDQARNSEWYAMLDRAAAGEVVKITRNGVELTINSLDGMRNGMSRVVESAMSLGESIAQHKGSNPSQARRLGKQS